MASVQLSNVPVDLSLRSADKSPPLTFIFGAARSGTTWLAKLFDSSPHVLYCHEPFTKGSGLLYHRAVSAVARGDLADAPACSEIVHELLAFRQSFARPPFFWKRYNPGPFSLPALRWYLGRLTGLNRIPAGHLSGPVHLVIKEGLTSSSLPLARQLNARAIVLFRHPCAVVNSRLRGEDCGAMEVVDRGGFVAISEALGSLPFSPREIMAMPEDAALALDWLLTCLPAAQLVQQSPGSVQWLTYESLVDQPELVLSDLFAGCGLTMTQQTRQFLTRSSEPGPRGLRRLLGRRARYFGVDRRVEEPAHQWQTELPAESIRRVMEIAELFPVAQYWPQACGATAVPEQAAESIETAPPQLLAGA